MACGRLDDDYSLDDRLPGLSAAMPSDLAPTIRVNGVFVGSMMTSALEFVAGIRGIMDQMETKTPLGRAGEAEDVDGVRFYSTPI